MGSDPGLATPDKGGEIVALAIQGLIDEVRAFEAESQAARAPVVQAAE